MRTIHLALSAVAVAALVSGVHWAHTTAPSSSAKSEPAAPTTADSVMTVIHKHVVERDGQHEPEEPERHVDPEFEPVGQSPEEAVFEIQQTFEALPRDPRVEVENESLLRGTFQRVAKGLPIGSFQCREASCRVAINFESAEQASSTMQSIAYDPEWMQAGFGFNVVQQHPENPQSTDVIVYFTRAPALAKETGS